jgi:alpha-tubulin suppressor-like RCC1 family protein
MKKNLLILLSFLSLNSTFAQKDLLISGGNSVSSMVCGNRKAYVFGPGLVSTSPVVFPGGVDIKQISSGSGNTFVAVDCFGYAFAWGNNKFGQVGNGLTGGTVANPTKVLASASIAASNKDASGYLLNVAFGYAGNNNCYAVLNDGKLVGWGHNSSLGSSGQFDNNDGQLGDGTTTDQTKAVYVIDGTTGLPLSGVSQVYAGDNVTYALVGNIVYSFGNGYQGALGRDIKGGVSKGGLLTQSSYAYPVWSADRNTIMDNIVSISAGDVFGIALDKNGYVWTWGNGAWNHATGSGYAGGIPYRVLKGSTSGASNDGTYLLAKDIGGGQGYGMAVTIDGKPVAWGGGGCAGGGATGNGTMTGSEPLIGAGYILYAPGAVHNDVISICRGDLFGWYVRTDGSVYGWGCNSGPYAGVLGNGNTIDQPYATKVTSPSGCIFRDPVPTVLLSPRDTSVCQSKFIYTNLRHQFLIDPTLAPNYEVRWYKGAIGSSGKGSLVSTTNASFASYKATSSGKYNVEIEYIGSNKGCAIYELVRDSMNIFYFPPTFTAPTNLTYCNAQSVKVNVTSMSTTNPVYDWFATTGSTTVLGSTIGSSSTSIDISTATPGTGTDKMVYAEEKSYASGVVLRKSQACDPTWMTATDILNVGAFTDNTQSGFTISEPITLTSLSIMLQSDIYTSGAYQGTLNFAVFGSKTVNGGYVADQTLPIGSFSYAFNRTRNATDPQSKLEEDTVQVNVKLLKAGTYFISLQSFTNVAGSGGLRIGRGNCSQIVPVKDNVNLISFSAMSQAFSNPQIGPNITQGRFFNVNFKAGQKYCDRVPVVLKQCVTVGIDELKYNINNSITVFPNPASIAILIHIAAGESGNINLDLYDVLGQKLQALVHRSISKGEHEMEATLGDVPSGIYFIKGDLDGSTYYKKIIVSH